MTPTKSVEQQRQLAEEIIEIKHNEWLRNSHGKTRREYTIDAMLEFATALNSEAEAGDAYSGWTSIKHSFPELESIGISQMVLVKDKDGTLDIRYYDYALRKWMGSPYPIGEITHWKEYILSSAPTPAEGESYGEHMRSNPVIPAEGEVKGVWTDQEAEFNEKYKGRSPFAAHIKNEKQLSAEGDREGMIKIERMKVNYDRIYFLLNGEIENSEEVIESLNSELEKQEFTSEEEIEKDRSNIRQYIIQLRNTIKLIDTYNSQFQSPPTVAEDAIAFAEWIRIKMNRSAGYNDDATWYGEISKRDFTTAELYAQFKNPK